MNKARAQIGGKPEWGPPVMMPPKDRGGLLGVLSTGLSFVPGLQGLGLLGAAGN